MLGMMQGGLKQSKHELIPQNPPTPHLRLTRPGSSAVQVGTQTQTPSSFASCHVIHTKKEEWIEYSRL